MKMQKKKKKFFKYFSLPHSSLNIKVYYIDNLYKLWYIFIFNFDKQLPY